MTESEAKTKICCGPMQLYVDRFVMCQGSACMAWRKSAPDYRVKRLLLPWRDYYNALSQQNYELWRAAIKEIEIEGGWHSLDGNLLFGWSNNIGRDPIPSGFCGLASKQ